MSDPAAETWQLLRALVMENHDHRKEACDALGLSFIRIKALRRLSRQAMSMRDLAALLLTDAPYVTVIIDDLEQRGLVERTPNPLDRRSKLVGVTPAGRQAAGRAEAILNRPPVRMAELSEQDVADLQRIVRVLSTG